MPRAFVLAITHTHDIDRHIIHMRLQHLTDLVTRCRAQFFGWHSRCIDLQQLVLLRTQHDGCLCALQAQALHALDKHVVTFGTLLRGADGQHLESAIGQSPGMDKSQ